MELVLGEITLEAVLVLKMPGDQAEILMVGDHLGPALVLAERDPLASGLAHQRAKRRETWSHVLVSQISCQLALPDFIVVILPS